MSPFANEPSDTRPSSEHKKIIQDFQTALEGCWKQCAPDAADTRPHGDRPVVVMPLDDRKFLDVEKLDEFMSRQVIGSLLKAVMSEEDLYDMNTMATSIKQKYLRLFALLLRLGEGSQINNFRSKYSDSELPFLDKPGNFPSGSTLRWEAFQKEQHSFFPIMFGGLDVSPNWPEERLMPFVKRSRIGSGGFGTVSRVDILDHYNKVTGTGTQGQKDSRRSVVVIKTYTVSNFQHYNNERTAFRILQPNTEGLINFYGSFQHGATYNIVTEWADRGTLTEYLQNFDPPTESDEICDFWKRITKLAIALRSFAGIDSRYQGVHQDLKPDNILVFSNGLDGKESFKIADLGTCHVGKDEGQQTLHRDGYGTRECGAPEASRDETNRRSALYITAKVDVWSLGCIFSIVATWIISLRAGMRKFKAKREEENQGARHNSAFHNGFQVLKAVKEHHMFLLGEAIRRGDDCTYRIVHMLDAGVFVAAVERLDAMMFKSQADNAVSLNHARSLSGPEGRGFAPAAPSRAHTVATPGSQPAQDLRQSEEMEEGATSLEQSEPPLPPRTPPRANAMNQSGPSAKKKLPYVSYHKAWDWRSRKHQKVPGEDLEHLYLRNDHLGGRDTVFLVDCAASMRTHWLNVIDVIWTLGYIAKTTDDDGVDVHFMPNIKTPLKGAKKTSDLRTKLQQMQLVQEEDRQTNIDDALESIIDKRCYDMRSWYQPKGKRGLFGKDPVRPKPLNLYVLTDGKWEISKTGVDPIKRAVQVMNECKFSKHHFAIQFIQFGKDDSDATSRLCHLDKGLRLEHDIVDHTLWSSRANVWKMLLGALHERFDHSEESAPSSPNQTPRVSNANEHRRMMRTSQGSNVT